MPRGGENAGLKGARRERGTETADRWGLDLERMARYEGGGVGGGRAGCGGEAWGMVGRRGFMTRKGRVVNGCCAHPGKGEGDANGGIRGKRWSD